MKHVCLLSRIKKTFSLSREHDKIWNGNDCVFNIFSFYSGFKKAQKQMNNLYDKTDI